MALQIELVNLSLAHEKVMAPWRRPHNTNGGAGRLVANLERNTTNKLNEILGPQVGPRAPATQVAGRNYVITSATKALARVSSSCA